MPVEIWFPTVVFWEDVDVPSEMSQGAIAAVRERIDREGLREGTRATAEHARHDRHLDARVALLVERFRPCLQRFFFTDLQLDADRLQLYVGRCWPVVQFGTGSGRLHFHQGAVFSSVFYLQTPPGSGSFHLIKPHVAAHDYLPKQEFNQLTYGTATYPAVANRLLVFDSNLQHQGLPNAPGTVGERLAIAFDLYSLTDLTVSQGGMPPQQYLRQIV